jgi:hypothetical protein
MCTAAANDVEERGWLLALNLKHHGLESKWEVILKWILKKSDMG